MCIDDDKERKKIQRSRLCSEEGYETIDDKELCEPEFNRIPNHISIMYRYYMKNMLPTSNYFKLPAKLVMLLPNIESNYNEKQINDINKNRGNK